VHEERIEVQVEPVLSVKHATVLHKGVVGPHFIAPLEPETFLPLLGHDVDDASHGLGTVKGTLGPLEDLDLFEIASAVKILDEVLKGALGIRRIP